MSSPYASGKYAYGYCDMCSFRYPLARLKPEVVKTKLTGMKLCSSCWTPDQPQLLLGTFPVLDPQALRNPRPDYPEESRDIAWGWNPVGVTNPLTPDTLLATGYVGTVTVTTT